MFLMSTWWMTSSIMHSCDESDDSLRITSVEVEVPYPTLTNKILQNFSDKMSLTTSFYTTLNLQTKQILCNIGFLRNLSNYPLCIDWPILLHQHAEDPILVCLYTQIRSSLDHPPTYYHFLLSRPCWYVNLEPVVWQLSLSLYRRMQVDS